MDWGEQHYHVYSAPMSLVHIRATSLWIPIDAAPFRKTLYAALIKIRLQSPSRHVLLYHAYLSADNTMSAEEALGRIIDNTHEIAPNHTVLTVQDFYRNRNIKDYKSWEAVLEVAVVV